MFIAIVGTPSSGKRTILEYLVQKHKFQEIQLDSPRAQMDY
jgi:dCMP deaminase